MNALLRLFSQDQRLQVHGALDPTGGRHEMSRGEDDDRVLPGPLLLVVLVVMVVRVADGADSVAVERQSRREAGRRRSVVVLVVAQRMRRMVLLVNENAGRRSRRPPSPGREIGRLLVLVGRGAIDAAGRRDVET